MRRPPRHTQPDIFDRLISGLSSMTIGSALGVYGAAVSSMLAISFLVVAVTVIGPSFWRSDPTGLIAGNPSDVVLGDNLLTIDATGLTALCPEPQGDLNFCDFAATTTDQIAIINAHLNITNGSSIAASSITYTGASPPYVAPVADVEQALDSTSTTVYDYVLHFSLTPSRFPAVTFPTDQLTIDEDVGRRLRILETAPGASNITTLPAANITYTPAVPSNWAPAPSDLQVSTDQLAARVKTLETTTVSSYNVSYNGYIPYYSTNVTSIGAAADDTSHRLYDNVLHFNLTQSRFPAVTFPTDQLTIDEDVGRRLRILETAPGAYNITTLPAANISYTGSTPYYTVPVTDIDAAVDDLSTRYYGAVFNQTLPQSYFPTVSFPTTQSAININLGSRVGVLENATVNAYAVSYNGSSPNYVPSAASAGIALDYLGTSNRLLRARSDNNYYLSYVYGNDVTCDGTRVLPCASVYRTLVLIGNSTNQFAQISLIFDNGIYSETNFIAIPPNVLFVANEIGVFLIFGAGAGLNGGSWAAVGTGYVSFLRFGFLRCDAACNFDMAAAVPSAAVFSSFRFYNTSVVLNAPLSFRRRADTTSYFALTMESVITNGNTVTMQDLTAVSWSLSGDIYSNIAINYNSSSTYSSGTPTIAIDGMIADGTNTFSNYAFGVSVDVTVLHYISKGASTLTLTTVTGTGFNTHGDINSYGVINGGILTTGAGTVGFEYLTLAYGLGYNPTTSSDWPTVPVNQQQANDYLAARITSIKGQTVIYRNAGDACGTIISPAQAFLSILEGTPTAVSTVQGPVLFNSGGQYIGVSSKTFLVTASTWSLYTYPASAFTQLIFGGQFVTTSAGNYPNAFVTQIVAVNGGGATDAQSFTFSAIITLATNDVTSLRLTGQAGGLLPSACTMGTQIMSFTEI